MGTRRGIAGAVAAVAAVLFAASVAWACTGQVTMSVAPVSSGAPGSVVTVDVAAGPGLDQGPMQVRWNGLDGQVLATTDRSASLAVTIPQADPGVYYLVLSNDRSDVARAAFEVTGPSGSPAASAWVSSSEPARSDAPASSTSALASGVALLLVGLFGLSALAFFGLRTNRTLARRHVS